MPQREKRERKRVPDHMSDVLKGSLDLSQGEAALYSGGSFAPCDERQNSD